MAKKGRPFTYQSDDDRPVTISVRLPAELAELVKRYAAQHGGIQVSELIREGLEWRIGDGDPRGNGLYLKQPTGIRAQAYNSNTEIGQRAQGDETLQEVRALLAQQWEQIQALAQALERQRVLDSAGVYSSNTENVPSVVQDVMVPKVKVDKEEVLVRIQQMRDKGLDSTQITRELQAEGVPTLSAEAQLQAVVQILEHRAVEDCSEGIASSTSPASMDTIPAVQANVLQAAQNPALVKEPAPGAQTQNGNTVIQEAVEKHRGRKPVLRPGILALLDEHPEGLTAAELKVYLQTEKHIGDTLSGMARDGLLVKQGKGQGLRYQRATSLPRTMPWETRSRQ